jgi:hypothetical protein
MLFSNKKRRIAMSNIMKNLYFKTWFLEPEEIEARLTGLDVTWKRVGDRSFHFFVTPETIDDVRMMIKGINQENGSILWDTPIDYIFSTSDEIVQQIGESYGDDFPILTAILQSDDLHRQ